MSNTTSSIITIGREYGSGGRQIGQEEQNILALNAMIKNFWSARQMTAESVRSCLNTMMKSQPTVFCTHLLWIPIPLDILLRDSMICQ